MRCMVVGAMVGAAGSMACAQSTHVRLEASLDPGQGWSSAVIANPGDVVYVRVRVALEGATALGLAGIRPQPTLSNWLPGDERLEFTFPGLDTAGDPLTETAYNGNHVRPAPETNTGRMFPFGSGGQGSSSGSGLLTSFVDPGNVLRFAGSKNSTPLTNVGWGVFTVQSTPALSGSNFQAGLDVVVFRYAVRLGVDPLARQLVADAPREYIPLTRATWFTTESGVNSLNAAVGAIDVATITVIPVPWTFVPLALSAVASGRRRRGGMP